MSDQTISEAAKIWAEIIKKAEIQTKNFTLKHDSSLQNIAVAQIQFAIDAARARRRPRPKITENQILDLATEVTGRLSLIYNCPPITESEHCHLSLLIGQWLKTIGFVFAETPMDSSRRTVPDAEEQI